jgi:hypothetical protein
MTVLIPVSLRPALLRPIEQAFLFAFLTKGSTGLFEAGSISPSIFGAAAVRFAH